MHPSKALGIDGFLAAFFQKFWDKVGSLITHLCLGVFNGIKSVDYINRTLIALIPKVKDPKEVDNFRHISLYNMVYKIILKSIANRLKSCLKLLISQEQSAFVPGRQILDNVLVAFESMHKLKATRKGKNAWMALKLDMSKAYDRVNWDFLKAVMLRLGFDAKWVELIMRCITSVSYL